MSRLEGGNKGHTIEQKRNTWKWQNIAVRFCMLTSALMHSPVIPPIIAGGIAGLAAEEYVGHQVEETTSRQASREIRRTISTMKQSPLPIPSDPLFGVSPLSVAELAQGLEMFLNTPPNDLDSAPLQISIEPEPITFLGKYNLSKQPIRTQGTLWIQEENGDHTLYLPRNFLDLPQEVQQAIIYKNALANLFTLQNEDGTPEPNYYKNWNATLIASIGLQDSLKRIGVSIDLVDPSDEQIYNQALINDDARIWVDYINKKYFPDQNLTPEDLKIGEPEHVEPLPNQLHSV